MGTDDLFRKKRDSVDLKRRQFNKGKKRDVVLIVCEGSKTEPLYFNGFKLVNVKIKGRGYNSDSLVELAIREKGKAIRNKEPFDQIWCVFDRDSCPRDNFNNAFILAKQNKINTAYTNEAFELWYLLHFNFYDSAMSRTQYSDKLSELLQFKYEKNNSDMYNILLPLQKNAIQNATKLLGQYPHLNPERDNPSSTVHELVCYLNQWV